MFANILLISWHSPAGTKLKDKTAKLCDTRTHTNLQTLSGEGEIIIVFIYICIMRTYLQQFVCMCMNAYLPLQRWCIAKASG